MLSIVVHELLKDTEHHLCLQLIAGKKGLHNKITIPRIQKPGLALTGDVSHLHPGRIQVLGKPEFLYLHSLKAAELKALAKKMCNCNLACFVITRDNLPPQEFLQACEENNIPFFVTHLLTSTFINRASRFLDSFLTATSSLHGVLVDVFGVGVLLRGKSGIGKSECALDLILRGHRLIADDVVQITKRPPATLYGTCSGIIKYHMEIRGLGIINIRDLFGISAVRDRKVLEMVIELIDWDPNTQYDRLGIDEQRIALMDINLPLLQIPVRPGRNISSIIEVAARNYLIKLGGHHSAREFEEQLNRQLDEKQNSLLE